jgi:hypothetical protein
METSGGTSITIMSTSPPDRETTTLVIFEDFELGALVGGLDFELGALVGGLVHRSARLSKKMTNEKRK